MEQIDAFINALYQFLKASPLSLSVKIALMGCLALITFWFRAQIKEFLIKTAKKQREQDEVKDNQRVNEENRKDNRDLNKDQENVDNWAEREREKAKDEK